MNKNLNLDAKRIISNKLIFFRFRYFARKYTLPQGCNAENVLSNLSADGVLMITAPKLAIENKRSVPITQEQK